MEKDKKLATETEFDKLIAEQVAPLFCKAKTREDIDKLKSLGAHINSYCIPCEGYDGIKGWYTPLASAVQVNDAETARLLLDNGADVSQCVYQEFYFKGIDEAFCDEAPKPWGSIEDEIAETCNVEMYNLLKEYGNLDKNRILEDVSSSVERGERDKANIDEELIGRYLTAEEKAEKKSWKNMMKR